MTESHEAIEELLAGYALRSLSGPDADETDQLLTEHVPTCASCRAIVQAFGAVSADLALDAVPIAPPETLLPRLHRELEARTPARGLLPRLGTGKLVAAAASLVLVIGLGGLAVTQLGGATAEGQLAAADLAQVLNTATQPGAETTDLGQAKEIVGPGAETVYIFGDDVPAPPAGSVYCLWGVSGTSNTYLGWFVPEADGQVALQVKLDPTTVDRLIVTVEAADQTPTAPGEPAWQPAA